jgi:hypothetical protein
MVAKYADACNLFNSPDIGHKLDVLKEHCEREGRNYDDIMKTVYYQFDTSAGSEKIRGDLTQLAKLGVQAAIGVVHDVYTITPLEIIGREVIPEVADL